MTQLLLDEIHPGEILLEEFMKPMGITARQLSSDMDVPPSRISDIVIWCPPHHGRHGFAPGVVLQHGVALLA